VKTGNLFVVLLLSAAPAFAQDVAQPQTGAPGAIKATTRIMGDGSRATNIVNPDKREATETVTDAAGKMLRKTWFSLDERDFTTGAIHYDAKGNIRYKEAFKRDGADRITATYIYSKDDRLLGHRIYSYDAKGNVIRIDDYDAKGKLITSTVPTEAPKQTKRRR
jgi:YD repeat-containing protein